MIIIIGGGLSGLLTAYRLKQESIPFKVLEARNRVGGRINTVYGTDHTPVEMGATWFGKQHRHLIALLEELGIDSFEQFMEGKAFFQPFSTAPAESIQIPSQPPSYRIAGGSSGLTDRLYRNLDENDILRNQEVREIKILNNRVQVIAKETFEGNTVVLALPPKLWAKKISFTPNLPNELIQIGAQTHTWMEDSIKLALTYKRPFWQEQNQSGTLFSNTGPVTELYDHCDNLRAKYALCGFINSSYKQLDRMERQRLVLDQLNHVFGVKAEEFMDYKECVWSREENTFEESDISHYPHQNNGNPIFRQSFFGGQLLISGSESAQDFPGYMDGAVDAANKTAKKIIASMGG